MNFSQLLSAGIPESLLAVLANYSWMLVGFSSLLLLYTCMGAHVTSPSLTLRQHCLDKCHRDLALSMVKQKGIC